MSGEIICDQSNNILKRRKTNNQYISRVDMLYSLDNNVIAVHSVPELTQSSDPSGSSSPSQPPQQPQLINKQTTPSLHSDTMEVDSTSDLCPCGYFHGPDQGTHHDIMAVGLAREPLLRGPD